MPKVQKKQQAEVENEQVAATEEAGNGKVKTVLVEIPIGDISGTGKRLHIDVDLFSPACNVIYQIADGLDKQQARLQNGRRVVDKNAAIKWILEQVSRSLS